MTTPKKTVKSSRAAKAEFDRVITALEKENEVFHTSPDQLIMFFVTGILSSVGPASISEGKVHENLLLYFTIVLVTGLVLSMAYNKLATRTRKSLLLSREPATAGVAASKELKAVTTRESAYYALFSLNTIYLASFLLTLMYFLPGLQFSDRAKFTIASLSSSAVVSGLVSLQAL